MDELIPGGEWRNVPVPLTLDEAGGLRADTSDRGLPWGAEVLRVVKAPESGPSSPLQIGDQVTSFRGLGVAGGPVILELDQPNPWQLTPGARLVQVDDLLLKRAEDLDILLAAQSDQPHRFTFRHLETGALQELDEAQMIELGIAFGSLADFAMDAGGAAQVRGLDGDRQVDLPPHLGLRPSVAAPRLRRAHGLPLDTPLVLAPGSYLVISHAPGMRWTRRTLSCNQRGEATVDATPAGAAWVPDGLVPVHCALPAVDPFWILEREVTSAEYLEFLNQPETLALIDQRLSEGVLTRMPKAALRSVDSFLWPRLESGQFALPATWPGNWPVLGLTHADASAYCEWLSARSPGGTYRLPSRAETFAAGTGFLDQRFSWGERFSQGFANTCFSQPVARPERVFANVRDESPFGVYDSCGNALEWVSDWYDETRNLRHAIGGSWGQSRLDTLSVEGGIGLMAYSCSGETGFRMVWTPASPADGPGADRVAPWEDE